jgi:hypothetical protein
MTPNPPGQHEVLLKPADTGGTPPPPPPPPQTTTTVEGSIALSISGHTYELKGTIGDHVIVEYHATLEDAFSLGTVADIASSVAQVFHFDTLEGQINDTLKQLQNIQGLSVVGDALSVLTSATAKLTDLEINTQTSTYGVGLALDFRSSSPQPTLAGITLVSLGFKVTRTKTTTPPP